jgi:hypothetical protein
MIRLETDRTVWWKNGSATEWSINVGGGGQEKIRNESIQPQRLEGERVRAGVKECG